MVRAVVVTVSALAFVWLLLLHWPAAPASDPSPIATQAFGETSARSIIVVEPDLAAHDYRNAESLHAALSRYLDAAAKNGWIRDSSIIVFPEHVGTFLVAARAPPLAYRAHTRIAASLAAIADHPIGFISALPGSDEPDRIAAALFRARTRGMARDYQAVFSQIARERRAVVVAGSIILENPAIDSGKIRTRSGALYNVSAVFNPDGMLRSPLIFKREPVPAERTFLAAGSARMPVFETKAGKLGVLICADSWHPEHYAELAAQGVDAIVVPAFLEGADAWSKPWSGYVTPAPADVAPEDVARLSEGEAWRKYAMGARLESSGAAVGATGFMRGAPWRQDADGRTLAASHDQAFVGDVAKGGVVSVVWF